MALPLVEPLLAASSAVTTLIGSGTAQRSFRHGNAPEGVTTPYVTWASPATAPENLLTGLPPAEQANVRVDCWSDDDAQVEALASAVVDALALNAVYLGRVVDEQDNQTRRYRISLSFDFWVLR